MLDAADEVNEARGEPSRRGEGGGEEEGEEERSKKGCRKKRGRISLKNLSPFPYILHEKTTTKTKKANV